MYKLNIINFIKRYGVYLLLILLFVSHFVFISADPDINISTSRGPWTDEGVNTCQVRNLVNKGNLTLANSDNFIKTPLFGSMLYLPYKIFGTTLSVSRLFILFVFFSMLILIVNISKYLKSLVFLMIPILLLQYHVFHFSHYSMAEILCVMSILLGISFLYKSMIAKPKKNINNVLAALFFSIAYFLKIQFLYIIVLFPLFTFFLFVVSYVTGNKFDKSIFHMLRNHLLYLFLFGGIYIIVWYLPNKDLFNYIMINQTSGRFIEVDKLNLIGILFDFFNIFYQKIIIVKELKVFNCVFCISFLIGVIFLFSKKSTYNFKILFLFSITWFLIELHKFSMLYLPTRYLISFYFSMGLLIVVVIREGYHFFKIRTRISKFGFVMLCISVSILIFSNIAFYKISFDRRTYEVKKVNDYLKKYDFDNRPILGAWAPTLSWETKAISFPIWGNYFNDKKILETYHPKVIILEVDEQDSDKVFETEKIEFNQIADSIRYTSINKWKIKLIWLK